MGAIASTFGCVERMTCTCVLENKVKNNQESVNRDHRLTLNHMIEGQNIVKILYGLELTYPKE